MKILNLEFSLFRFLLSQDNQLCHHLCLGNMAIAEFRLLEPLNCLLKKKSACSNCRIFSIFEEEPMAFYWRIMKDKEVDSKRSQHWYTTYSNVLTPVIWQFLSGRLRKCRDVWETVRTFEKLSGRFSLTLFIGHFNKEINCDF